MEWKYRPHECLKLGDTVTFNVQGRAITYMVELRYLKLIDRRTNEHNDLIFRLLNLNETEIATSNYGYACNYGGSGSWPESKTEDYPALTRLVRYLYNEIAFYPKKTAPPDTSFGLKRPVTFILNEKQYKYIVQDHYLNIEQENNEVIFQKLGLSEIQTSRWASDCYGYTDRGGMWPAFKPGDYSAAKRFVLDIYRVLKEVNRLIMDEDEFLEDINVWNIVTKGKTIKETPIQQNSSSSTKLKQLQNGKIIKTSRITPAIRRGEKIRGCRIQGKTGRTTTRVGYLSNKAISG